MQANHLGSEITEIVWDDPKYLHTKVVQERLGVKGNDQLMI